MWLEKLKEIYKFEVKNKNENFIIKFLSFVLFFNKSFLDNFITTIGSTIYVPDKFYKLSEIEQKAIICHELIHILDSIKDKFFSFKYLFPQILLVLGLLAFVFPPLFLFFIFVLPIPAFFRKEYELKAYKMSIFVLNYYKVNNIKEYINLYSKTFTNSSYYFMWPFGVEKELIKYYEDLQSKDLGKEDFFEILKKII